MNDEAVRLVASYERPKLLNSPFGGRVFGHVPVDETPGADIEHHEDVYEPEPGCDRHQEVARQHLAGVIPQKRAPHLRLRAATGRDWPLHVASDRPRRDGDAQLEQQFGRDPFLTPRPIRTRHLSDQRLEVRGNPRTSTAP